MMKRFLLSLALTFSNTVTDGVVHQSIHPARIVGFVTDEETGLPIEGACVLAVDILGLIAYFSNAPGEGKCSDKTGFYSVAVPFSSYNLSYFPVSDQISFYYYKRPQGIYVATASTTYTVNVSVKTDGFIKGVIYDPMTRYNAQARISVFDANTGKLLAFSDRPNSPYGDNTVFNSGALPAGRYKLLIEPYISLCHKLGCNVDPYITEYFSDQPTWEQADVITVTKPNVTNISTITMNRIPPWLKLKLYLPLVNR